MNRITFPRKFTHGQKVSNVDVYGELFLWPSGHFQLMVHLRNSDPLRGNHINVSFVLFNEEQEPLGRYGMATDQAWSIATGQRHEQLFGTVPEDKLIKTAAVALAFRPYDEELDAASLRSLATTGSELLLCPTPD